MALAKAAVTKILTALDSEFDALRLKEDELKSDRRAILRATQDGGETRESQIQFDALTDDLDVVLQKLQRVRASIHEINELINLY